MKLSKNERVFLTTLVTVAQKMLHSGKPNGSKARRPRKRRSAADVALLKKEIRAARKQNVTVKQIADDLGVTTAYIYQLTR
jgi:hypothetical protein